jgi:hypothetical protein
MVLGHGTVLASWIVMTNSRARIAVDDVHSAEPDTIFELPQGLSVMDIAEQCRETALMFVNESAPWGKAELALWVLGPYGGATRHERTSKRFDSGPVPRTVPMLRDIDARFVDRFISAAHGEVMEALSNMRDEEFAVSFAFRMMSAEYVVRCEDSEKTPGWVPSTRPSRLADRVLSLFAVDYLARPTDDAEPIVSCHDCGHTTFEGALLNHACCGQRSRHDSGFYESEYSTLPHRPQRA